MIAALSLSPRVKGEEMRVAADGFVGGDRADLTLPAPQQQLLEQLQALNKPLVLVLMNGSAMAVHWPAPMGSTAEHGPASRHALVAAWYPGQAGGEALADILFGDYNPAGRLPVTFYRSVEDLPPFDDYDMAGRTYRYFRGEPLFPFGYGLSYTTFALDDLHIAPARVKPGGRVTVWLDVTNTGSLAGDQVVQLYIRHPDAAVPRPWLELKGFKRVKLEPGECKTVAFGLHTHQLGYPDEELRYVVHPGRVEVLVGTSSRHLPLSGSFEIAGEPTETGKVFFSTVEEIESPGERQ